MQNGIIYYPETINIGDDIQTYAASLLVDNPVFCDRENLNQISEPTNLLCNGWFMENPKNWPPSHQVKPFFTSFHINTKAKELMTSKESIDYLKKNEPIGCRDYHTYNLLKSHDVDVYFSGCLTLTLPKYNGNKTDEILFVDVLRTNYLKHYRETVVENMIPSSYKNKISFVSHFDENYHKLPISKRMNFVESLLNRYAKAKLVFTSLIHCALPCVAMGTPVVFIDFGFNNNKAKRDRFEGVTDFFCIKHDLKAPFMQRNIEDKIARGLRLYLLSKSKFDKLPQELFEYSEVTNNHLHYSTKIKESVQSFYQK